MMDSERHEMELERTHPSGAEEWYCPTCGRRFLMQWPPHYKKIVLEQGDENALHSGGKGGLSIMPMAEAQVPGEPLAGATPAEVDPADRPDATDKAGPPPWLRWLEGYDPAAD